MSKKVVLAAALLVLVLCGAIIKLYSGASETSGPSPEGGQPVLETLSSSEFERRSKGEEGRKPFLLDVREPEEFASGHLPGAVNIPLSQLKERLKELPKDQDLLLYCRSGNRSKQAGQLLLENGFRTLCHLDGGLGAWSGPLVKD